MLLSYFIIVDIIREGAIFLAFTFHGGIHPDYQKKRTADLPIVQMPAPARIIMPLIQHIGAVCEPLVGVGDTVTVGQKIADSSAYMSCPVHSSVSGVVTAIEDCWHSSGIKRPAIVIENDGKDTRHPDYIAPENVDFSTWTSDQIILAAREAGITGMGGAGFPLHVKLKTALEKKVNTILINGAECEPYITADHRAMLEYPRKIIAGIQVFMQCLGCSEAIVGIENNKPDAIRQMRQAAQGTSIRIAVLKTKYPQGGEKQLIYAITGRKVPPGKLPMDVGCAVFNVDTCASVYRAIAKGRPLIKRVVTVSGSAVREAKNLLVRIGTPYQDLFEFCGGFVREPYKVICGGPMMGSAQHHLDTPVMKSTSALLAFAGGEEQFADNQVCIHCGRCVSACPMNLMPNYINRASRADDMEQCKKLHVMDCIECGCCAYVCPAKLYLVQTMRMCKAKIMAAERAKKA